MCCTRLAENTGRKKSPKICHLCTITQLCRPLGILSHRTHYLELASRPTQRLWLHWVYIPTVTEDILLQPVLACCSTLEVFTIMRYINLHFTYLLHLHSWGMYRQSIRKKLVKSNTSSTCLQNMVNFSPATAEIGLLVCGTPANFNRFPVLASLLHQHRSTEVNQTLHDVWLSPGLAPYIYISGALVSWRNFDRCKIHSESKSCIILYWQCYCMALEQWASANFAAFSRGSHLYLAGRPSRWASAHILVLKAKQTIKFSDAISWNTILLTITNK